ncbi:replication-relaxation family protein [Actinomadura keratinilytica]|uniref:Replication-relaxation n=1 Tax=Actinomadura keratinilytica TaxID=547461 RepID=A0ABP7Y9M5_9ACTN
MTRPSKAANRTRRLHGHRPRITPELIADLAHQLTERDRTILELVWEHRVLTTDQITAIFFPGPVRARQRLRQLRALLALVRFQPWTPVGSAPQHWVLGPAGAHVLAAQRGIGLRDLGYRQDNAMAISLSPRLGHQVGVNDFFARLHACARHRADGTVLAEWWPERRCASLWGDLARPDAFGRWVESQEAGPPAAVDFFLEHDTGSEPLSRVAAKLAGYAALAESTGITTPVLFWLPSAAREANLRKVLGTPDVPVATAVHTPRTAADGPAGPVWLPVGTTGPRRRLAALADAWGPHDRRRGTGPGTA